MGEKEGGSVKNMAVHMSGRRSRQWHSLLAVAVASILIGRFVYLEV